MAGTTKFVEGWKTGTDNAGLSVGFAFGSAPFASSCSDMYDRTWYTASTSVRSARTFRGRTHELDRWGPGTATIVLDNRSRLFDPACSTNAQAGKVLPGVPVRIDFKKPGSTAVSPLWSGFVESWDVRYPGLADATVTVKCVDGTKFLNLSAISTFTTADLTNTMIGHVLDGAGWPSSTGWRDFGVGLSSAQRFKGFRTPALQLCRDLADSEAGAFLMGRDGKAFFRTRRWWALSFKSTEAVFGDSTASTELPYTDLDLSCDDGQLWNHVTVNRVRGAVQSTWSTASMDLYGKRVLTVNNLLCPNATKTLDVARWLVKRYENPGVRVERLECKPRTSTGIWDVAARGLGETYRVVRRPPGGGEIAQVCHVEGIENVIDVGGDDWTLGFSLSPASLFPSSSL